MTKRKIEAHESGGNIFADLELPDADGLLLKSSIVIELHRLIKERGLTQVKAAKLHFASSFCKRVGTVILAKNREYDDGRGNSKTDYS